MICTIDQCFECVQLKNFVLLKSCEALYSIKKCMSEVATNRPTCLK